MRNDAQFQPRNGSNGTAHHGHFVPTNGNGKAHHAHTGPSNGNGNPADPNALRDAVENALADHLSLPALQPASSVRFEDILTHNDRMKSAIDLARRVSGKHATVLITGESGTGKGFLARAIHDNSPRRGRVFHTLDCATVAGSLAGSDFFGHVKGAFTGALQGHRGWFELAHGGTLFLDEIAELSTELQGKLLRVIEEGILVRIGGEQLLHVDVRVIAATNRNLKQAVTEGRFRQDLYHRVNLVVVDLPPLRERREDVTLLADHFLERCGTQHHRLGMTIHPDVVRLLVGYSWPGNVRELRNLVERGVIVSRDDVIGLDDLPFDVIRGDDVANKAGDHPRDDRAAVLEALAKAGWRRETAAGLLGITRRTLYVKMQALGISANRQKRKKSKKYQKEAKAGSGGNGKLGSPISQFGKRDFPFFPPIIP